MLFQQRGAIQYDAHSQAIPFRSKSDLILGERVPFFQRHTGRTHTMGTLRNYCRCCNHSLPTNPVSPALDGAAAEDSARRRSADSEVKGFFTEVDGVEVVAHVRAVRANIRRRSDPELAVSVFAEALHRAVRMKQEKRTGRE